MLIGTADVSELGREAPTIASYFSEPLVLEDVALFQMILEMRNGAREAVLPPSLHPTVPAALSMQVWQVGTSPWGAFAMAVARVSCRSGVRARGFTTAAVVSTQEACAGMRESLGYPARVVEDISFGHSYSGVTVCVGKPGKALFQASAIDPEPLDHDDVQYTGTLNLAHVHAGLRLVQVEFHDDSRRVERLRARLQAFEPAAWGNPLLDPYYVVASSLARGNVTFPPLRFVCRPGELAFTGTEPIARPG